MLTNGSLLFLCKTLLFLIYLPQFLCSAQSGHVIAHIQQWQRKNLHTNNIINKQSSVMIVWLNTKLSYTPCQEYFCQSPGNGSLFSFWQHTEWWLLLSSMNINKIRSDRFRVLLIKLHFKNVSHLSNSKKHKWGKPKIYNDTHHK